MSHLYPSNKVSCSSLTIFRSFLRTLQENKGQHVAFVTCGKFGSAPSSNSNFSTQKTISTENSPRAVRTEIKSDISDCGAWTDASCCRWCWSVPQLRVCVLRGVKREAGYDGWTAPIERLLAAWNMNSATESLTYSVKHLHNNSSRFVPGISLEPCAITSIWWTNCATATKGLVFYYFHLVDKLRNCNNGPRVILLPSGGQTV